MKLYLRKQKWEREVAQEMAFCQRIGKDYIMKPY